MRAIVWAEWLLWASCVYLVVGALLGLAFLIFGIKRVDPAAIGAPITFKLIVLPGTIILWPVVLIMWLRSAR